MKKYLFVCALLSALNTFAKTGDTFNNGGVTYQVIATYEGGGEVAACALDHTASLSEVFIPSTVSVDGINYNVTTIAPEAFKGSTLKKVTLNAGVTTIERGAFQNCSQLTSVTLPSTLRTIDDFSFSNCSALTSVSLPSSVSFVGRQAFSNCSNITQIVIPSELNVIGEDAFLNCTALKAVSLPITMTSIPEGIFEMCEKLENVTLPDNIKYIGKHAFSGCETMASISLTDQIETIGTAAFAGCKGLTSVSIPESVTCLQDGTFAYCTNLKSVTLPNAVTAIGSGTFKYNQALTHITLPSWLKNLGLSDMESIFERCDQMTELTIPAYVQEVGEIDHFPYALNSIYVMGDKIPDGLSEMAAKNRMGEDITIYVKRSIFNEKYSSGEWNGLKVDYRIPIVMTNTKGATVKYKTLCRDFDIDLTHTNDNLVGETKKFSAYVVDDADGELGMVFMDEINYIPSRLKANVDGYKGEDQYVGIVVKGTPGATYYYEIGENDYTQGADGQWLLADIQAASKARHAGTNMMRGVSDASYIFPSEVNEETGKTMTNYGLNNNAFRLISSPGWLAYNKSYLPLPENMTNSNFSLTFTDADGTTDIVNFQDFINNCDDGLSYDLSGRKVKPEDKGLVIQKGKKRLNR